jgi:hypothetical protein
MSTLAGAKLDATDFALPDVVAAHGNGTNTITSATFAALPTNTVSAAITNPHPTATMLCLVTYGAWMSASSGDVRYALNVSGSATIAAGIGGGAAIGYGEIPISSVSASILGSGSFTVELPASATAATFTGYAMRTGSGTVVCNYPTVRIVPLRFLF